MTQGTFGIRLAQALGAQGAGPFLTRARRAEIEVTHMTRPPLTLEKTPVPPGEDALLLAVHLADCEEREVWIDDRPVPTQPVRAGSFVTYDLGQRPSWRVGGAMDLLAFHVPRHALGSLTDAAGLPRLGVLTCPQGQGQEDAIVRDLATLLLPAFAAPQVVSRLFVDNVVIALCAHITQTYGDQAQCRPLYRGGLASWQERRAKEMLSANLVGTIRIAELADECGLSTSQFSRSFRQSTGLAPHQWLINRRIEVAKDLLVNERMPLSEISLACGFADQSHFTRVFSRLVGVGPGAWRRSYL